MDVKRAMDNIESHENLLIEEAFMILGEIPLLKVYGQKHSENRTSLVAFNYCDRSPMEIADELNQLGIESRSGCHCATLAHYLYELNPPASCRSSFYIYNDIKDVRKACNAIKKALKLCNGNH